MRYKKRTGYEKGLVFRPLLIGQFTRRAFSWLPIIRASLSLSHSFTIYIVYQATRIVEWCSPPSDGDKPKRYNAYEARDTNNTKGSAPRTRDHGSRVEIFREDSVRFATQGGGERRVIFHRVESQGRRGRVGRGVGKGLSGIRHGVSLRAEKAVNNMRAYKVYSRL